MSFIKSPPGALGECTAADHCPKYQLPRLTQGSPTAQRSRGKFTRVSKSGRIGLRPCSDSPNWERSGGVQQGRFYPSECERGWPPANILCSFTQECPKYTAKQGQWKNTASSQNATHTHRHFPLADSLWAAEPSAGSLPAFIPFQCGMENREGERSDCFSPSSHLHNALSLALPSASSASV